MKLLQALKKDGLDKTKPINVVISDTLFDLLNDGEENVKELVLRLLKSQNFVNVYLIQSDLESYELVSESYEKIETTLETV